VKITLDAGLGSEVPDDLYDLLLEAFFVKAAELGLEVDGRMFDNWRIECDLVDI